MCRDRGETDDVAEVDRHFVIPLRVDRVTGQQTLSYRSVANNNMSAYIDT